MDNFKSIYWILSRLEKDMDKPGADLSKFDAEALGISEERWKHLIEMISDSGYVKGVQAKRNVIDEEVYCCDDIRITLTGLEYLKENSAMKKVHNALKGIKEATPGL